MKQTRISFVRMFFKIFEVFRWMQSACLLKAIPYHPCVVARCLTHLFPPFSTSFLTFAPGSSMSRSTEVSSEHTPIILPSRRVSLDTNADDLVTTLDASEVCDKTDVGRLTSPLSQEREVRAIPFGFSCSQVC